jgi:hypothetical protein
MPELAHAITEESFLLIPRRGIAGEPGSTEGVERMTIQPVLVTLKTDSEGWPLIQFDPEDQGLRYVGDFLQSDVDILLPACDLLLKEIAAVREGNQPRWTWNGNCFVVEVEKGCSNIIDKYGDADKLADRATVDTAVLLLLVGLWKRFVSTLPRQQELAAAQRAQPQP